MIVKNEAIVISSIKYGDNARIVKCYTKESGIKSFIVKGVYAKKNKTNPMFVQLNHLELIFNDRSKTELCLLSSCRQLNHYQSLNVHQHKTAIALFIAEILNSVLKEEEANTGLYDFICRSVDFFDQKEKAFSDFHLWFLMNLSAYLGFYPNLKEDSNYFDLTNGVSSAELPSGVYIDDEKLNLFKRLYCLNFFDQTENQFNREQRNILLDLLLRYYELHHTAFRWPRSLEVLNVVFG